MERNVDMLKKYSDFMDEINEEELYKGLLAYGMFSEKLPPIFTAVSFYNYCINNKITFTVSKSGCKNISYEIIKNTGKIRKFNIPNPMAYYKLCNILRENWGKIKKHFHEKTDCEKYKVSRIHIRKIEDDNIDINQSEYIMPYFTESDVNVTNNKNALFNMGYKSYKVDGSPEDDNIFDCKYVVKTDISSCFPSIYTHSLPWALATKCVAKNTKGDNNCWYNKIDNSVQKLNYNETHGIMIGPHTSNLLSEIILTSVDYNLSKKWKYIRNIDDYICFVKDRESANKFIIELTKELNEYSLQLNSNKTKILNMSEAISNDWVNKIIFFNVAYLEKYNKVNYKQIKAYFDFVFVLMKDNDNNIAILNYAIKVLSRKNMTENGKRMFLNRCIAMTIEYPYLVTILDEIVFERVCTSKEKIREFADCFYSNEFITQNYIGCVYAIYYSLKYGFKLKSISVDKILATDNCLLKLMGMLYFKSDKTEYKKFKKDARMLYESNKIDENWIYVYETLNIDILTGDWKKLKEKKISFLKIPHV